MLLEKALSQYYPPERVEEYMLTVEALLIKYAGKETTQALVGEMVQELVAYLEAAAPAFETESWCCTAYVALSGRVAFDFIYEPSLSS